MRSGTHPVAPSSVQVTGAGTTLALGTPPAEIDENLKQVADRIVEMIRRLPT